MTAQDIIDALIDWHKDASIEDVNELMASRALICDYPFILEECENNGSSNEQNACDWAAQFIRDYFSRAA